MDAFMAQSAALGESASNWSGLQQAAAEGKLQLEPGVAEQCAKHCEDMIDKLDRHISTAQMLAYTHGMGDCVIGRALNDKFAKKAAGATNSLISVLRQHQDVLTEMAATYRAAGKAFSSQEHNNAAVMNGWS